MCMWSAYCLCAGSGAREQVDRSDVDAEAATNRWFVLHCEIAIAYIIVHTMSDLRPFIYIFYVNFITIL